MHDSLRQVIANQIASTRGALSGNAIRVTGSLFYSAKAAVLNGSFAETA
jgi:hypothetical protein